MRTRGIIFVSMLAAFALVSAGASEAAELKVLAGPAWGRFASDWEMSNDWKPGFLIGLGVEGGAGLLGYEVDLLYFKKANSYVSRGWDYELEEISVPFLAKVKPFLGSTPFLLAGGELAYILSSQQKPGPFGEDSYDMMDNTRRVDYGLLLGVGYGLEVGGLTLELSGRYHHGLAKVTGLGWKEFDLQTRALAVVLGVVF